MSKLVDPFDPFEPVAEELASSPKKSSATEANSFPAAMVPSRTLEELRLARARNTPGDVALVWQHVDGMIEELLYHRRQAMALDTTDPLAFVATVERPVEALFGVKYAVNLECVLCKGEIPDGHYACPWWKNHLYVKELP